MARLYSVVFASGRRVIALIAALAMLVAIPLIPSGSAQGDSGAPSASAQRTAAADLLGQLAAIDGAVNPADLRIDPALGPPPWVSFMPGRDESTIEAWKELASRLVDPEAPPVLEPLRAEVPLITDAERPRQSGLNDTIETGQAIPGFGTGPGESRLARLEGLFSERPRLDCPSFEDDSAIDLANRTRLRNGSNAVLCGGEIGDNEYGDSSGDIDFYNMNHAVAGSFLIVDVGSFDPGATFSTTTGIYFQDGTLLATLNDADNGPDSVLAITAPEDGKYYAAVAGVDGLPENPFDPASGPGATSTGDYLVALGSVLPPSYANAVVADSFPSWDLGDPQNVGAIIGGAGAPEAPAPAFGPDVDVFLIDLEVGDAFSIGMRTSGFISIVAPDGRIGQQSFFGSGAFLYPRSSPLLHFLSEGGDFVAEVAGQHAVVLSNGFGSYLGELRVYPSGLKEAPGDDTQIIFLDFDGGEFKDGVFDLSAPENSGETRTLSPLSDWLSRWDLDASDEDAVIDSVIANFAENLEHDLKESGNNGNRDATGNGGEFNIEIRNSRDHADPWGEPNVSRVIIGGSIAEANIFTIGIAQSIDPGNFDTTETAIVLLDVLSGPRNGPFVTLNNYDTVAPFDKIDLVGQGVGVIVAHEVGHFIGNWHTASFNEVASVMDEGGDLDTTVGVGPDQTLGTADDVDTDFVTDEYSFFEGFGGFENTTVRSAQGLSTGQTDVPVIGGARCAGKEVTINMQNGDSGIGTLGDDVILGTSRANVIDGRGGNDTICALGGDDEILGGSGRDAIYAGPGDDDVRGGRGNDQIWGQEGNDYMVGNSGLDSLYGGVGDDTIVGSDGDDTIAGYIGNDRLFGGAGNDAIEGGAGRDRLTGGDGNDDLAGNGGNDVLIGNGGDDVLHGGSGTDTCRGGTGANTVTRCEP